ncbi:hypothetical protein B566_EDAN007757 [Ephemera danica]|nr:hypothetical protein B566_EDAN007757 [Ephemera danica]
MKSPVTFLMVMLLSSCTDGQNLCSNINAGMNHNVIKPKYYTCIANNVVICRNENSLGSDPVVLECNEPEGDILGGSKNNTFCYAGQTRDHICGPPPPKCTVAGTFPVPGSQGCKNFYSCVMAGNTFVETVGTCPNTLGFNSVTRTCDTSACRICEPNTKTEDPSSCRHYLICAQTGLSWTRVQCHNNTRYNDRLKNCVFYVNCGKRPIL